GRAEGGRVRERDVEVVPQPRRPALASKLWVLVLWKLEVGFAGCGRQRPGDGAAAVEFPEGEAESDGVCEPHGAAAGKELRPGDVDRGMRDQRGDENDDTEHVEDPERASPRDRGRGPRRPTMSTRVNARATPSPRVWPRAPVQSRSRRQPAQK